LIVVLVLGYGLYTGTSGAEQLFRELLGQDAGSGSSSKAPSGLDPSTAPGSPVPPSPSEARALLREVDAAPAGSMVGYSREDFPHWATDGTQFGWDELDGSCDERDDALVSDGHGVKVDEECSITAGEWLDPYTGTSLTDSEKTWSMSTSFPSPTPGAPAGTIGTKVGGRPTPTIQWYSSP
jgi:hypothetical protein